MHGRIDKMLAEAGAAHTGNCRPGRARLEEIWLRVLAACGASDRFAALLRCTLDFVTE